MNLQRLVRKTFEVVYYLKTMISDDLIQQFKGKIISIQIFLFTMNFIIF